MKAMASSGKAVKRGAFLVFEGCDRSGKSTQSKLLLEKLAAQGIQAKHMVFPERNSNIGREINAYLKNTKDLSDEVIHLLFSANRWEFKNEMKAHLEAGTTLVVDRYSYSGVAYSTAKGLDYEWCFGPEAGLLRPDVVFYLKTNVENLLKRGEFGEERYEKTDLQRKVATVFERICEQEQDYWQVIDASSSTDVISQEIFDKALEIINKIDDKPCKLLALRK